MARTRRIVKEDEFIEAYIEAGGLTTTAAKKVGVGRATAYEWFKDPDFVKRLNARKQVWLERLRAAAFKRAMEKSDVLLIFLMKSLAPENYDDEIRRARWLAENKIQDPNAPQRVQVMLVADAPPWEKVAPAADESTEH